MRGHLVDCLDKIFDQSFFRVNYPEKRVRIHDLTCTIILVIYHIDIFNLHATAFGSLSPILRDLDSRLGGCGVRGIDYLFFKFI
jgi:hypothetical protein